MLIHENNKYRWTIADLFFCTWFAPRYQLHIMVIKQNDSLVDRFVWANQSRNNAPGLTGMFQKYVGPTTISLSTLFVPLRYISPTSPLPLSLSVCVFFLSHDLSCTDYGGHTWWRRRRRAGGQAGDDEDDTAASGSGNDPGEEEPEMATSRLLIFENSRS